MTFRKAITLSVILCAVGLQTAHAYIPPFWFAVRSLAQSRKDLQTVSFKSRLTANGSSISLSNFYNFKEGTITLSILDSSGRGIYTHSFSMTPSGSASHLVPALLFQEQSPLLARSLVDFGFPIAMPNAQDPVNHEKSKLVRESDKIGYLYLGKSERRLILEKDLFQPILLESKGTKIVFKNYKLARFVAFPKMIQVFEAGSETPVLQEEISEILINPTASKQSGMESSDTAPDIFTLALKWLK